ncbi:ALP1-like protein isoform X1 [Tanacetum coccineum]
MNSYAFMGLDVEEGEEVNSRRVTFIKRAIAFIKSRRQANRLTRNHITRDHSGAHERLVAAFFSEDPMYDATRFWKTFRMARPLFNQIVIECTFAICQLAYGFSADFLDEYMQISERTSRTSLDYICQAGMDTYGPEYLRRPTVTDIEKLYRHHKEKHGFPGMLGSLDCTDWEYVAGLKNNVNVLYQSLLFNDLKTGRSPEILFVADGVIYPWGYFLVDGIYPELATLVKTIPEPADDDNKQILYKLKRESTRKDVERAFGVLKKK